MWTVEKITKLCVEYCGRCDVTFHSPVSINGRLTRTLGRCFCQEQKPGWWTPIKIEISRQLLETATDESIMDVIAHECAHYVCCEITHEDHGHDDAFRFYCEKIGTSNNVSVYSNIKYKVDEDSMYKYTFYCSCCGEFLGGRSRACKITKNLSNFRSSCCNSEVKMKQNW